MPNATGTQILIANGYGRAGTFQGADGSWSGFVERKGGKLLTLSLAKAAVSITALGADS
jgi:hypothetical protein